MATALQEEATAVARWEGQRSPSHARNLPAVTEQTAARRAGAWVKEAARAAGIPVFSIKSAGVGDIVKALRTLVGIDPSPGGLFADGDDYVTGAAGLQGGWAGLGGCYSMVRAAQQTALHWQACEQQGHRTAWHQRCCCQRVSHLFICRGSLPPEVPLPAPSTLFLVVAAAADPRSRASNSRNSTPEASIALVAKASAAAGRRGARAGSGGSAAAAGQQAQRAKRQQEEAALQDAVEEARLGVEQIVIPRWAGQVGGV